MSGTTKETGLCHRQICTLAKVALSLWWLSIGTRELAHCKDPRVLARVWGSTTRAVTSSPMGSAHLTKLLVDAEIVHHHYSIQDLQKGVLSD